MKQFFFLVFSVAVILSGTTLSAQVPVQSPATTSTPPAGDPVRGKAHFLAYGCYECHGTMAQGNYFGGPHLAPNSFSWSYVSSYVRRPAGQMPSFAVSILPERDLADIYAYLKSIPVPRPAANNPALSGFSTTSK